jgi:ribosomal protein S18 acetylase RimI-like enzyme
MKISIQKASVFDIILLQKICKQTFLETYSSDNKEENMIKYIEEEFSAEKLEVELMDQNAEFYFALLESKIIGYLKINLGKSQTEIQGENALEIQRIYVLKEFQGKKIGISLYEKAMEIARKAEVDYVWLGVWEENPTAIQFYEKVGFKAFDKHTFVLGDDVQTDIMMKQKLQ